MEASTFEHKNLQAATFTDVNLAEARFDNVNLSSSQFNNINLRGSKFTDINFSHASIEESCIDGLVIWGMNIRELIEAEWARRKAEVTLD